MKKSKSAEVELTEAEIEHARVNAPTRVTALALVSYDGDPDTEGSEYYAPKGYEHRDANGDVVKEDDDGKSLVNLPSEFVTTRAIADAMAKAKMVDILK
jgi:hypothetical protein